jgi:hypothetical protein
MWSKSILTYVQNRILKWYLNGSYWHNVQRCDRSQQLPTCRLATADGSCCATDSFLLEQRLHPSLSAPRLQPRTQGFDHNFRYKESICATSCFHLQIGDRIVASCCNHFPTNRSLSAYVGRVQTSQSGEEEARDRAYSGFGDALMAAGPPPFMTLTN